MDRTRSICDYYFRKGVSRGTRCTIRAKFGTRCSGHRTCEHGNVARYCATYPCGCVHGVEYRKCTWGCADARTRACAMPAIVPVEEMKLDPLPELTLIPLTPLTPLAYIDIDMGEDSDHDTDEEVPTVADVMIDVLAGLS